jgi:membrane protein DedA with SNARE-associated domain
VLPPARLFRRPAKTVFIPRFVALLRITTAVLAGISHMHWWSS